MSRLQHPSRGQLAAASRSGGRGTSLVEVLVASAVMAVLMIGVLQVFSLALLTNQGSAARTELTYRAQQVIENLRMIQYFAKNGNTTPAANYNVATTPGTTGSYTIQPTTNPVAIPNDSSQTGFSFWQAAGVVNDQNDPYRIFYTVTDQAGAANPPAWADVFYQVTVTAMPLGAHDFITGTSATPASATARGYVGEPAKMKRVDYVAQIPR